ncbi:MAG: DUF86 domain-containing protein [Opitutae bacterium]|nr:DUF86 domain-containing protein [Opitutae bacterium]
MTSRSRKLLFDVQESGRSIQSWCAGRSFAEYELDRQFRRAVEREFEIIGEALNRVSRTDPILAARITELLQIVGFRNRIIHGYDTVDNAMVWGVIEARLPRLMAEVDREISE